VSRRVALRGAVSGVGVAMWLPVLDAMCNDHGDAFAVGDALPTTFGIWFWGNGTMPPYWTPSYTNNTDWNAPFTYSGDEFLLPRNLEPFSELKDHVTFVGGLDMLDGLFKGHGWGNVYMLAGGDGQTATVMSDLNYHQGVGFEVSAATQYVPTIDQLVADYIGADSRFASLETGVQEYRGINMGTTSENLAHRGPNDFLPPERDPRRLFDSLFSSGVPSDVPGGPSVVFSKEIRRSTLDAVLEDAASLRGTLGATDSARLERHMDSIREIERRLDSLDMPVDVAPGTGCVLPGQPAELVDPAARGQAIHRLIATALACNLTRVYTHLWSGGRDDNTYAMFTGRSDSDHHTLTHGITEDTDAAAEIERYIMEQYADLVTVLRDTPIGNTTALNQTLIYGATEVSDARSHVMSEFNIVLAGHAGGKIPGNKHIWLPKRKVTELQLTMMQTMGLPIENFGSWDNTSTTIPEILA
jgi:hypothetical protein